MWNTDLTEACELDNLLVNSAITMHSAEARKVPPPPPPPTNPPRGFSHIRAWENAKVARLISGGTQVITVCLRVLRADSRRAAVCNLARSSSSVGFTIQCALHLMAANKHSSQPATDLHSR